MNGSLVFRRPVPGSVCRVRPRRVGVWPVLALVDRHLSATITVVRLLTNEVEMATGAEQLLPAAVSGLPYDLLVHDFPGYVRTGDLDPPLTVIDPTRVLGRVPAMLLTGPSDVRWGWKLRELKRMQATQPPLSEVLEES